MYQQYNPFMQAPYQMPNTMGNYLQDLQYQPSFQNMSPEMQQQAMARHQAEFDQHTARQQMAMRNQQFQNNPFAGLSQQHQEMQHQGMHPDPFAGLSQQQQQEILGQFASGPQQPPVQDGFTTLVEAARRRQGIPEPQQPPQQPGPNFGPQQQGGGYQDYLDNFQGGRQLAPGMVGDMSMQAGRDMPFSEEQWDRVQQGLRPDPDPVPLPIPSQQPQQPGPNFRPQQPPGPQFGARPPQNGFAPGPWGAGGPSQMLQGPRGGNPMHPGNRQPPQHWTPPSVNMPMSQRDQPWMGGQSQLAAQYGGQNFGSGREYQGNPFAQQRRQSNPFQRRGNLSKPDTTKRPQPGFDVEPRGPQPALNPPSSGGNDGFSRGGRGGGGGPTGLTELQNNLRTQDLRAQQQFRSMAGR